MPYTRNEIIKMVENFAKEKQAKQKEIFFKALPKIKSVIDSQIKNKVENLFSEPFIVNFTVSSPGEDFERFFMLMNPEYLSILKNDYQDWSIYIEELEYRGSPSGCKMTLELNQQ